MKKLFPLFAIAGIIFLGCKSSKSDAIRDSIPGVYTKKINDEFTKGVDTIFISILDDKSGSYSVVRRTSYQQSIDGNSLSPRIETHKMIAIYNEQRKQLYEQNQGRVFSFSPDKRLLNMGGSEYGKVSK